MRQTTWSMHANDQGEPTELYMMYELATRLGQTLTTIQQMTVDEFNHWWTFFRLKQEISDGVNGKVNTNARR